MTQKQDEIDNNEMDYNKMDIDIEVEQKTQVKQER